MLHVSSWLDWCLALLESVLTVFCTAFFALSIAFLHFMLHFCILHLPSEDGEWRESFAASCSIDSRDPFCRFSAPYGYHRIKISFTQIEEIDAVTCLLVHTKLQSTNNCDLSFRIGQNLKRKPKETWKKKAGLGVLKTMVLFQHIYFLWACCVLWKGKSMFIQMSPGIPPGLKELQKMLADIHSHDKPLL